VIKFRDEDDLIKMANDTLYGLSASVFSRDITKAITTANALHAGTVWINSHHIVNNNVPFGGYKRASCLLHSLPMLQNVRLSDCGFLILGL
jgi:aldehyde dehydrogenase (NAD+)